MGILSRFRDIMRANVNSFMDRAEDPAKAMDEYMRSLHRDLGQVKAEMNAVLADERRAKASWNECEAEIKKLQRYAEKTVEAGREDDAIKFLERKAQQAEKLSELQKTHELAASKVASMKQLQEKLMSDIGQLEARHSELKEKLAAAKLQQGFGAGRSTSADSFDELEEKAYLAAEEAIALAELKSTGVSPSDPSNAPERSVYNEQATSAESGANSDTSPVQGTSPDEGAHTSSSAGPNAAAPINDSTSASVEAELATIKARINKKQS
ncbi:PspA/IM30 family protein [Paenibacillus lentus]|uniref:PspA/IM30 family protein n=1 Tax=Paenibacillus lentus TaxID=1338368 RepID=A0A3S8RR23_9BACL|nr:PspA/IM30 family protein [Paenibacillus lentus]AZK45299.1 PspA/IM30 family protein [Paenibacillus lentus]